jgi:putative N6-adenine-specific DNA methylase
MQKIDKVQIFGYDIDDSQVKLSRSHAKKAGVSEMVTFECKDMKEFTSSAVDGVIVTNPPYGERLLKRNEIVNLYKNYGEMLKKLNNWSIFTITSVSDFERLVGKKADKKRKIHNGKLECTYYSIYSKKF